MNTIEEVRKVVKYLDEDKVNPSTSKITISANTLREILKDLETLEEFQKSIQPIHMWFNQFEDGYQPLDVESFYQVDSVILALPELGVACLGIIKIDNKK